MTPIHNQSRCAVRRFRPVAGKVILAASVCLAWLWPTPAHATSASGALATAPTNLLLGDNATFSTSIGAWSGYSDANVQWAPTSGEGGTGGLSLTASGPKMTVLSGTSGNGGLTPAAGGSIYSAAVSAIAPSGPEQIQPALLFYAATGTEVGAVFGPATHVGTSSWSPLAPVVAIAPASASSVALGLVVYNPAAGATAVIDNAWVEQTNAPTAPTVVGPLSTSGNKILQANGTPLIPRGVVLNGLEDNPAASTVTQLAVIQAKSWGANVIRVPLGEQFWLSSSCTYAPSYQAEVSQVVNWITSLGMVALLDLHTNTVLGCGDGSPHNMADETNSPTFWSQVASEFASNPLVAFDLYNEPHDISNQVWLNGGVTIDSYAPFLVYQAAGMQQLYNTVRSTGARNLVFVSGLDWANHPPSQLVTGQNIVYAVHAYTCQHEPPPNCDSPTPYDPSAILQPWVSFSASQPVALTEFGWPSQYDGTYTANVIAYARAQGWGWIAFAWEDAHDPAAWDITAPWLPNSPTEPAPSGIPVICELTRVSSGASPCSAPSITTTSTPTQTATPAPTGKSGPTKSPAASPPALNPNLALTPTTGARTLAAGSVPTVRGVCVSGCYSSRSVVATAYYHSSQIGKSGNSRGPLVVRSMRLAGIFALVLVFLLSPIARRLDRVAPART